MIKRDGSGDLPARRRRVEETWSASDRARRDQVDALRQLSETLSGRILKVLVERRSILDLSQAAVARRMGLPQSAVARLESGAHSPTLSTLCRYAAALDATIEVQWGE